MEFFLGKTRVYISFWFLCLAALAALYDKSLLLLPLLAAVALHEAVHLFFLLSFQIRIRSFSLLPYGARLDCDLSTLPAWKKAAVYRGAPAAGLCVGLFYRAIDPASIFGVFNRADTLNFALSFLLSTSRCVSPWPLKIISPVSGFFSTENV